VLPSTGPIPVLEDEVSGRAVVHEFGEEAQIRSPFSIELQGRLARRSLRTSGRGGERMERTESAAPPSSARSEPAALLRFAEHVLIEYHDEWDGAERRRFSDTLYSS